MLLIVIAACIGLLWPWAQLNFLGNRIAEFEFDKIQGLENWQQVIELSQADNPVRIRLKTSYQVGAKLPPLKVPVKVMISDAQGTLLSGTVSFPTRGISTGPELEKVRGSQGLEFDVLNNGNHAILVSLAPNSNNGGILKPAIGKISAIVVGNAPELNDDHKALAAIIALCGLYLVVRNRRRKTGAKARSKNRIWGKGK